MKLWALFEHRRGCCRTLGRVEVVTNLPAKVTPMKGWTHYVHIHNNYHIRSKHK